MPPKRRKMDSQKFSIISWYNGNQQDSQDRYIRQVLRFTNCDLWHQNDLMPLLFPLPWPSRHTDADVVISEGQINYIRGSRGAVIQENMSRALKLILSMFNLELVPSKRRSGDGDSVGAYRIRKIRKDQFNKLYYEAREVARRILAEESSHHHGRITRVLRSLRLFGLDEEAATVYRYFRRFARENTAIPRRTAALWKIAAKSPNLMVLPRKEFNENMSAIENGELSEDESDASITSEETGNNSEDGSDTEESESDLDYPTRPKSPESPLVPWEIIPRYTGEDPRDSDSEYEGFDELETEEERIHHRVLRHYDNRYFEQESWLGFRIGNGEWFHDGTDPFTRTTEEVFEWQDELDRLIMECEKEMEIGLRDPYGDWYNDDYWY